MPGNICDRSNGFWYFPYGTMRCQKRTRHRGKHRAKAVIHEGNLKHTIIIEWFGKHQDYR